MTGTVEEPGEENAGFLVAGVVLGILASMSGTAGKQFLRFSELQRRKGTPAALCIGKAALACGLVLNILIGPLVDMGSYAFAPQSLIAPLSGLDVVWNTVTAPFTLGETLTLRLFCGCAVITGGAIVTSLTGSHDSGEFTVDTVQAVLLRPAVFLYLLVLGAWLLFNVLVLMPRSAAPAGQPWQSGDRIRGLSLGMTAGSIAGNMFCVKAFVEIVQESIRSNDGGAWLHWLPYGLLAGALVFALSNLYFLTKAMREYESLFMGAVFEGSLIISACTSGVVVFSELESLQPWQVGLYWAALLTIVCGIYVVCTGCAQSSPETKDVADAEVGDQASEQAEEEGEDGPETKAAAAMATPLAAGSAAEEGAAAAAMATRLAAPSTWRTSISSLIAAAGGKDEAPIAEEAAAAAAMATCVAAPPASAWRTSISSLIAASGGKDKAGPVADARSGPHRPGGHLQAARPPRQSRRPVRVPAVCHGVQGRVTGSSSDSLACKCPHPGGQAAGRGRPWSGLPKGITL